MQSFADPDRLGSWRLLDPIGRGASSVVYRAEHELTKARAAVKVLVAFGISEERLERFHREARLAARINDPHIVRVYDAGQEGPYHYIVYELVEGASLGKLLKTRGALPTAAALKIARHVARALCAIHKEKLVHRDLKPDNILIDQNGTAKLADLGLGKDLAVPSMTVSDQIMGTPFYMAPEQARSSKNVDHRADQYALGATLYHALTGVEPFSGDSALAIMQKHITDPVEPVRSRRPEVHPEFAALVERLLSKEPSERFPAPDELSETLERLAGVIGDFDLRQLLADTQPETTILTAPGPTRKQDESAPSETKKQTQSDTRDFDTQIYRQEVSSSAPERKTGAEASERRPSHIAGRLNARRRKKTLVGLALGALAAGLLTTGVVLLSTHLRSTSRPEAAPSQKPLPEAPGGTVFLVEESAGVHKPTGLPRRLINRKDGGALLLVPGGTYLMGYGEPTLLWGPPHSVTVESFYLGETEVTNEQFLRFVRATGYAERPSTWEERDPPFPPERARYPVCGVSWRAASAYARWAGGRLPTEVQWERAARGEDGRLYPWGPSYQPGRAQDASALGFKPGGPESFIAWRMRLKAERGDDFLKKGLGTAPAGSYRAGAGPYGHLNLAANVAEWTADDFHLYPGNHSPSEVLPSPDAGPVKVVRGNSWWYDSPLVPGSVLRSWLEASGGTRSDVGFRVAFPVPSFLSGKAPKR